jgi:hypothetical protein
LHVELLSHTADPERTVAAATRLCYSASGILKIRDAIDDREAARLIKKVLLHELLNAAFRIHDLLPSGEERMTRGADL